MKRNNLDIPEDYEENDKYFHKKLRRACTKSGLLNNLDFLRSYPDIMKVAEVLYLTADIHYRQSNCFKPFDDLNIEDIDQYLILLNLGNRRAIELYEKIKQISLIRTQNPVKTLDSLVIDQQSKHHIEQLVSA